MSLPRSLRQLQELRDRLGPHPQHLPRKPTGQGLGGPGGEVEWWSFMCKRNGVAFRLCRRTHLVGCHQQRGTKLLIIIKIILSIYKLVLHFLGQHWRVSSVLALTLGPCDSLAPRCYAGRLRRHRLAVPGLPQGAGSDGESWGLEGCSGWSCWMELSVWWSRSQALCQSPGQGQTCFSEAQSLRAQPHLTRAMRCRACSWTGAAERGLQGQGPASPPGRGVRHSGGGE